MLKESFSLMKPTVKMKLFKLTIIHVVTYGSLCWNCDEENIKKERKRENVLQEKCVKWMNNGIDMNQSCKDLLLATEILPISLYLHLPNCLPWQKCINRAYEFDCSKTLTLKDPARNLRSRSTSSSTGRNCYYSSAIRKFFQGSCACPQINKES